MELKEPYLSQDNFETEISLLLEEVSRVPARKRMWNAGLSSSALIVTDLQNYFLTPDSHAFIPSAPAILPNIRLLAGHFRKNHRPVIFTRHINGPGNAESMNYWWNDMIKEESSLSGLYGNLVSPGDIIITKHQYDSFHGTDLEAVLRNNNVLYPVICGVIANLCCETTVRTAFVKGFRPVMPFDTTAAYNKDYHLATFRNLAFGFSPLLTCRDVLKILSA